MSICNFCNQRTHDPCESSDSAEGCVYYYEHPKKAAEPSTALKSQVGGDHYKNLAIQPMEYSMKNKLDACQHTAIKYITRFRDKGTPLQDLEKAKHAIDLLIEFEGLK